MSTANLDAADLAAVDFEGLINEDVMNSIWDISNIPLDFTEMIGADTTGNAYASWTQDRLQDVNLDNALVDGADTIQNQDTNTGARVGNRHQISTKTVKVSTRARSSETIGFSDTLEYQVMMRQRELRRDVEGIMLTQQASVEDDGNTTPGRSAGVGAWLVTNTDRGATGADGGFSSGTVSEPTPGTTRALTETAVRDIAQSVWEGGGNPSTLMSTPACIRNLSEYMFSNDARIATLTSDVREKTSAAIATGSVNIFITDFGVSLAMVPNRLMPAVVETPGSRNVNLYCLDPEYWRQGFLTGYRVEDLSKTGTADNRQMLVDWTLKALNEEASGVIADIDDELPVTQV